MIHCKRAVEAIVSPKVPSIGEMIYVEGFGHALVENLYYTDKNNYIRLRFQDTIIGEFSSTIAFMLA